MYSKHFYYLLERIEKITSEYEDNKDAICELKFLKSLNFENFEILLKEKTNKNYTPKRIYIVLDLSENFISGEIKVLSRKSKEEYIDAKNFNLVIGILFKFEFIKTFILKNIDKYYISKNLSSFLTKEEKLKWLLKSEIMREKNYYGKCE